jgi:S1-C subfamily serine protease
LIVSSVLERFNEGLAEISERALRSLVRIQNGRQGIGAGIIWHADGLIVTNHHVVAGLRGRQATGSGYLTVVLPDGRELPATVVAHYPEHDLAALRVEASGLPAIALGDSQRLQAGELVLALGFPWGVTGGATSGVVIGVGAGLPELRNDGREWLAASLHLRPGHSGGPMIDAVGRLVGINTMMNGPDVGVAVPVHVAKRFLKQADEQQVRARTVII